MKILRIIGLAAVFALVILVVMVGFIMAVDGIFGWIANVTGQNWLRHVSAIWLLLLVYFVLPKRWKALPIPYQCRGEVEIAADRAAVWHLLEPRGRTAPFQATIEQITEVPGQTERLDYHFDPALQETAPVPLQVVVQEKEHAAYAQLRYLNAEKFPLFSCDLEKSEYFLEATPNGTKVTMIEHFARIRMSLVLSLLLLNPCRDSLKQLKAAVEGKVDPSWMGWASEDMGPNGEPRAEISRAIHIGGLTMCIVVTAAAFGVMWFALSLTTGGS